MVKLNLAYLMTISIPIIDQFAHVEPKRWNRKTILLELLGELETLAHYIQYWEGAKYGNSTLAELGDECSDVLFIILRLAWQDALSLPQEIDILLEPDKSATDIMLELYVHLSTLYKLACPSKSVSELVVTLQKLGTLADLLGIDLVRSHELEMRIASKSFQASGDRWPTQQFLRHPIATIQLWKLKWQKNRS